MQHELTGSGQLRAVNGKTRFSHIPEFPMNDFDVSFLVDSMVKWDDIYACVMGKKNELLREGRILDTKRRAPAATDTIRREKK